MPFVSLQVELDVEGSMPPDPGALSPTESPLATPPTAIGVQVSTLRRGVAWSRVM